ncbi:MAG: ABC transporter permease [Pelolinea sp.]|nr:ABC transporter permease [Pelolinea sp.]
MEKKQSFLEKVKEFWKVNVAKNRTGQLVLVLIGITIFFILTEPKFFRVKTYESMLLQMSELGILAIAVFLCILVGGLNISVMANANLAALAMGSFILANVTESSTPQQIWLTIFGGIFCALIIGALGGLLNGLMVGYAKMPPLLATLGTATLFTGIQKGLTGGESVWGYPPQVEYFGNGKVLGLPLPFIMFFVITMIIFIMLKFTRFGYKVYMTGANQTTAKFSGIPTERVTMFTYIVAGMLSSLTATIVLGRTMSANSDYGLLTYVLFTIFVAVVSGSRAGFGSVITVFIGMFALQTLQTGFNYLLQTVKGSTYFRDFIWGLLLIIFLIVNYYANVRRVEDN